ncbi:MAG: hypothetical protein IPG81_27895 [Sandaracinaceae bacterium]|nr:hypothetical protein [Sandaracinaceae bacterium]
MLYSNEFAETTEILRWQILGDFFKVVCFPLGYIILAAGEGRNLFSDTISSLYSSWWCGLECRFGDCRRQGVGFLVMYAVNLPIVFWLAHGGRLSMGGNRLEADTVATGVGFHHLDGCGGAPVAGAIFGSSLAGLFGAIAVLRFGRKLTSSESTGVGGIVHRVIARLLRSAK